MSNVKIELEIPEEILMNLKQSTEEFKNELKLTMAIELYKKNAEWQSSHEKLSFQGREIGSWIFAEAELEPPGLLTLLQLDT